MSHRIWFACLVEHTAHSKLTFPESLSLCLWEASQHYLEHWSCQHLTAVCNICLASYPNSSQFYKRTKALFPVAAATASDQVAATSATQCIRASCHCSYMTCDTSSTQGSSVPQQTTNLVLYQPKLPNLLTALLSPSQLMASRNCHGCTKHAVRVHHRTATSLLTAVSQCCQHHGTRCGPQNLYIF